MATYDKSSNDGYDAQDAKLQDTLEEWVLKNPKLYRNLCNRAHDGIIQRIREQATRKCVDFAKEFEKCVNAHFGRETICFPHKEVLNQCVADVNTEDTYQKLRLAYITGELKRMHDERLVARVESFKSQAPESLPNWKVDYTDRFYNAAKSIDLDNDGVGAKPNRFTLGAPTGQEEEYFPVKGGIGVW
jgi:hypothetical protein